MLVRQWVVGGFINVVDTMEDLVQIEHSVDDCLGHLVQLDEGAVAEYAFTKVFY